MLDIVLMPPAADDAVIVPPARSLDKWSLIFLASGLVFLIITGHTWFRVQDATAEVARFSTAPVCAPGSTTACHEVRGATIRATRVEASSRTRVGDRWVTLQFDAGQTQEIFDKGPDLTCCDPATLVRHNLDLFSTLQPGMPVQADYWAGTLTDVYDLQGKRLITEDFPLYRLSDIERWMYTWALLSGVCLLPGLLALWPILRSCRPLN